MNLVEAVLRLSLILLWAAAAVIQTRKIGNPRYDKLPMIKSNLRILQIVLVLLTVQEIFFFADHVLGLKEIFSNYLGLIARLLLAATVLYLIYFKKGFKLA